MAKKILFQGDSITDCGRDRNFSDNVGRGYALLVKAELGVEATNEYEFINRGIGGDRVVDLYARIKGDFINLKPDYASIYVGVNDVWHEVDRNNGVETPRFEKMYSMLIDEIKEACPDTKLFLIAPFVIEGSGVINTETNPDRFEQIKNGVAEKAAVCKKIAEKYALPLIELQPVFDEACKKAPPQYWTVDGVHPTICGHELIKRKWLEAFEKIK